MSQQHIPALDNDSPDSPRQIQASNQGQDKAGATHENSVSKNTVGVGFRGNTHRYSMQRIDPIVPSVSVSQILLLPPFRRGRKCRDISINPSPEKHLGDAIIQKSPDSTRLFFQSVKGLTYSTSGEDYCYYFSCLQAYDSDILGLAETNACWSHFHLQTDFRAYLRRYHRQNKIAFGAFSPTIDPCPERESFQAGGNVTVLTGTLTASATSRNLSDPTGLGTWSGILIAGKHDCIVSIFTAYQTCAGSPHTSPLGSTLLREYKFLVNKKQVFL
jgi:hypothetical protein